MKNTCLTTLAGLLLSFYSFGGVVIRINLVIGKKSQPTTCPNFGFCDFSIQTSYQDGFVNGTLDVDEIRGSMIIAIYEKDIRNIQVDKMIYFQNKSSTVFSEDYMMPSEINIATKATKPIIIKKGEYQMTYKKGIYYIEFPL